MEFSLAVLKPQFTSDEYKNTFREYVANENLKIYCEFRKKFSYNEVKKYFTTSLLLDEFYEYLSSDFCYVFLVAGEYCAHKLRQIKKSIRKNYHVDSTIIRNVIHSADSGVEFFLQKQACKKELAKYMSLINGYADMCVTTEDCERVKADKRALIFSEKGQVDFSCLENYDYLGYFSKIRYKNGEINLINYCVDNIIHNVCTFVMFTNEMYNDLSCLDYLANRMIKGILLYTAMIDLSIAEKVEDYLEERIPDWIIIGGKGVTIGQHQYEKFCRCIAENTIIKEQRT